MKLNAPHGKNSTAPQVGFIFVDIMANSIMHVYFAAGSQVICKGSHASSMGVCDHEEADTRMCIHIQHTL